MATERGPLRWQTAKITRIAVQTPRVKSFWLRLSQPFDFRAGQHVDIRLTADDGYSVRRSYSIASAPGASDEIELAIELMENGEVSPFFHEVAQEGDDIELRGPIGGYFIWNASNAEPVLLIGGGSGIVPLMSMARHHAKEGSRAPMLLLYSARTREDLMFRDELAELRLRGGGFQLVTALTRDAAGAADYARRVDAEMMQEVIARLPARPREVFVCGSNPFVEAANQSVIAAGIAPSIIRNERYGG
ncbi:MAG: ferredoxin reductase [Alphaproteobacteria bacterium]